MKDQHILAAQHLKYQDQHPSNHHHHLRQHHYPGPQSMFDRHLASSYEDGEHDVLQVKAIIKKNNKENKRPSIALVQQQQQEEEQKMIDRSSYITKYASLKEMELEYLSQKNKQKFELEMRRKSKGPKDYSNLELSPNVINIQTINRNDNEDLRESEEPGNNVVEFSLKDSSLMPSPQRITHNVSQNVVEEEPPLNYDYSSLEMRKLFKNKKHNNS